jgi:hypothetical protein
MSGYISDFTMTGGEISGNLADGNGGGVCVGSYATFTKAPAGGGSTTSGTIYGYTYGVTNSNRVGYSFAQSDKGHAVYVSAAKKWETTVDSNHDLDSTQTGPSGGWE